MKRIKYITILFAIVFMVACDNDDYLTRIPETSITEESFWKSTQDLKIFVNQFYATLPNIGGYNQGLYSKDGESDNMIYENYNTRLAGFLIVPTSGSSLNYGNIRSVNYFLESGDKLEVTNAELQQKQAFLGEGHFFRAWYYFDLLQKYGGVPWIDKVLKTTDEELYAPR